MSAEAKLEKFVRRVTVKSAGYTSLCLMRVQMNGGTQLRSMPLDAEFGYDTPKISEMVAELLSTAQEDADGHSGVTSYCVIGMKGASRGDASPKFRLRCQEADIDTDALGETEPATKDGHLAQLMRHNEAFVRVIVQQQEVQARQSTDIINRLVDREKHYEDRHWDTLLRAEELADEREERELGRLKVLGKEKRLDKALEAFKPLVPVVLSKLKGLPPQTKAGLNLDALKMMLESVSPAEMQKIAEVLGPRSLALAEMYMDAHKEEDAPDEQPSEKTHS